MDGLHIDTATGIMASSISRIFYASSNHAVGRAPRSDLLLTETPPRPDTFYGVGKVAAVETQEVAGMSLEVYVVTFDHEKMTLRVPTKKAKTAGLRSLAADDGRMDAFVVAAGSVLSPTSTRSTFSRPRSAYEAGSRWSS